MSGLRWFRDRLGLTPRGLLALSAAVIALGAAVIALGGVSEDVTQHNGQATHDAANLRFFTDHRSDVVIRAARILTDVGGVAVLALVAIGAGLLLWRRGLPVAAAAAPAFALGVAATFAEMAKQIVDRTRPAVGLHLVTEGGASFPSGHATDSAAVYLTLGLVVAVFVLRRPLARVAMVAASGALVAAIGASRLVLGVHWPTDVLAGWALGVAAALVATIGATLLTLLVPPDSRSPEGRLRRAAARLAHLLASARPQPARRTRLRAA